MGFRAFALRTVKGTVRISLKAGKASVNATRKYVPKAARATHSFGKDTVTAAKDGWKEGLS